MQPLRSSARLVAPLLIAILSGGGCTPASNVGPSGTAATSRPSDPGTGLVPTPVADPGCESKLEDASGTASALYGLIADAKDPLPLVTELVECMGIAVVPTTADDATIQAVASGAPPAVLGIELDAVAAGLESGILINIDSIVDDLREKGATSNADGQPLTRSAFDNGIQTTASSDRPVRIIPRLLQAISQERAQQVALDPVDSVWGDPSFDPFQMLLIYLGLEEASRRTQSAPPGAIAALAAWSDVAEIGSGIEILEYFTDAVTIRLQHSRFLHCASVVGGFARLITSWFPASVWHRGGPGPETSEIRTLLTMVKQFTPRETAVLELLGCRPPSPGGIGGKTVIWYVDANAGAHGSLTAGQGLVTDKDGVATTTYQTITETTPQSQRIPPNEQQVNGTVTVQVQDLLTEFPNFSAFWRALKDTSAQGSPSSYAELDIHWYEPIGYTVKIVWTEQWRTGKIDEGTFEGRLDTPEDCFPVEHELCLKGTGTVSGHRGGWQSCNPGIKERPEGVGVAEFHATIDGDEITLVAFAAFTSPIPGLNTVLITVPREGGHHTGKLGREGRCGTPEPVHHTYTYDLTLTPLSTNP